MAVDISHDCQLIVGQQSVDRYAIISQHMGQESINIMLDKFQCSTKHFTYTSPTIQWYSTEYELPIG